jgi:hypothetical protein
VERIQIPVVKTPLSIIALFVVLIELFLAYPVTQLEGTERLILVVFMTVFPLFVSSAFFIILWHRPRNLYSPGEIAEAAATERRVAAELKVEELEQENQRLRQRATPTEAAVLAPDTAIQLSVESGTVQSDVKSIEAEVRDRIQTADRQDETSLQAVKRDIRQRRQKSKAQKARRVEKEMSRFRDWLEMRGFKGLPDLPKIIIEAPDFFNAYYNPRDNSAHFGEVLIEDSDAVAQTYFHIVIQVLGVLEEFQGETAALAEAYCDYYACSYNDDPYFGEKFAVAVGLKTKWLRNLLEVVQFNKKFTDPHTMGLVWSGACWELRAEYGAEKMDSLLRNVLTALGKKSSFAQAAQLLADEMVQAIDQESATKVRHVFQKRGVQL